VDDTKCFNDILPVINLTEEEKKQNNKVSFLGKLHRQENDSKKWKEYIVLISDCSIILFDENASFCSRICLFDSCKLCIEDCIAPLNSFPFTITQENNSVSYYARTSQLRDLFAIAILSKSRQLFLKNFLEKIPNTLTGWVKKQGNFYKTWKKRFLILQNGRLQYSSENEGEITGEISLVLGEVKICTLGNPNKKEFRLIVSDTKGKVICLRVETIDEMNSWHNAIKEHIKYASM
jgi:hypothetical protein